MGCQMHYRFLTRTPIFVRDLEEVNFEPGELEEFLLPPSDRKRAYPLRVLRETSLAVVDTVQNDRPPH